MQRHLSFFSIFFFLVWLHLVIVLQRLEPMVQVQCVTRPEPMLQRLEPMVVHYVTRPEPMVVQYVPEPEPEPEKQLQHQLQLRRTISASF